MNKIIEYHHKQRKILCEWVDSFNWDIQKIDRLVFKNLWQSSLIVSNEWFGDNGEYTKYTIDEYVMNRIDRAFYNHISFWDR